MGALDNLLGFNGTFGTGSPAEEAEKPAGPVGNLLLGLARSAATLPQRAIQNSQFALNTGNYDPRAPLEAATLPMGSGAIAGVPMRAGEAVLGAGPIRAYHGSPHDFDAFSMDKIGTGEGAQAYGHGLYFADREGVARGYRDQLANGVYKTDNGLFDPSALEHLNVRVAARNGIDDGIARAQELMASQPQNAEMLGRDLSKLQEAKAGNAAPNPGHMYEVNINADPAHFLDWDKPLSQQHPVVQDAATKLAGQRMNDLVEAQKSYGITNPHDTLTGQELYRGLSDPQALNQAGIPGIKYLDQGSRGAGEGSSNYVVFKDDIINIVRKYAAAGIAVPPAIMAQYQKINEQQ